MVLGNRANGQPLIRPRTPVEGGLVVGGDPHELPGVAGPDVSERGRVLLEVGDLGAVGGEARSQIERGRRGAASPDATGCSI